MSETGTQTTVNVETASVQEPIEVVGGSSPVSWDELASVDNWRKGLSDEPEVKTAQRRSEEGDELEQVLEEKQTKKGEKHGEEKSSKEKTSKENEVTAKTKEKQHKETKESLKTLKFKQGESSLDVSPEALVTVKVDGKNVEVPVQEVINRYSQQKHLDDLFRKHKTERQEFETNRTKVAEALKQSYDLLVEKQDLKGFADSLAESLGVDGEKIYNAAVDKIRQQIEEEATLTPDELRLRQLERENELFKSRAEAEKAAKQTAAKVQALDTEVSQILQQYKIEKADFVKAYDDLVASQGVDPEQLTPELIANYHNNMKVFETVQQELTEIVGEEQADEATIQKIAEIAILAKANKATIRAAIAEEFGLKPEKQLSRKINKTLKQKQVEQGVKRAGSDTMFFDDL